LLAGCFKDKKIICFNTGFDYIISISERDNKGDYMKFTNENGHSCDGRMETVLSSRADILFKGLNQDIVVAKEGGYDNDGELDFRLYIEIGEMKFCLGYIRERENKALMILDRYKRRDWTSMQDGYDHIRERVVRFISLYQ